MDRSLVLTIPTLDIDTGQAIMGWCTCRRPGIPYPYAVHEYQGPPRAGAHMGVLDAHVWTGHWFRPFRLYILTWDRPSWAGVHVGVQDSHIYKRICRV